MSKVSRERQLFDLLLEQIAPIPQTRSLRGFVIPLDLVRSRLDLGKHTSSFTHTYDDIIRTVREHTPEKRGSAETVAIGIAKEWQPPKYREELLCLLRMPPDRTQGRLLSLSTEYTIPRGRTIRPRRRRQRMNI